MRFFRELLRWWLVGVVLAFGAIFAAWALARAGFGATGVTP